MNTLIAWIAVTIVKGVLNEFERKGVFSGETRAQVAGIYSKARRAVFRTCPFRVERRLGFSQSPNLCRSLVHSF